MCCSRVPFECKWRGKVCHYTYFEKLWVKCEGISISKANLKHCIINVVEASQYWVVILILLWVKVKDYWETCHWQILLNDYMLLTYFSLQWNDALQRWIITRFAIVCHGKNEVYRTTVFKKILSLLSTI